jgi:hypothetical protein
LRVPPPCTLPIPLRIALKAFRLKGNPYRRCKYPIAEIIFFKLFNLYSGATSQRYNAIVSVDAGNEENLLSMHHCSKVPHSLL